MSKLQAGQAERGTMVFVNPYEEIDKAIPRKDDSPKAIGRVRVQSDFFPGNIPGDRISLEPKKAAWLAQKGFLILEIASVLPSQLEAAGGVENYLKANPNKDKLSKHQRAQLKPIPGMPSESDRPPWEYMDVDE